MLQVSVKSSAWYSNRPLVCDCIIILCIYERKEEKKREREGGRERERKRERTKFRDGEMSRRLKPNGGGDT